MEPWCVTFTKTTLIPVIEEKEKASELHFLIHFNISKRAGPGHCEVCKMTIFYASNGFGCHFQWLTPFELKFYMEQRNVCINFSYFMGQPLKVRKNMLFFTTKLIKKKIVKKKKRKNVSREPRPVK